MTKGTSKGAAIIPFPASKRVGKIRRAAEVALRSTSNARIAYRERLLSDLERQMRKVGVPEEEIQRQVAEFDAAVITEAHRQHREAEDSVA